MEFKILLDVLLSFFTNIGGFIFNLIHIALNLDHYLNLIVAQYGLWIYFILFLVIFCETGLVATPFLPGDSLLFIAGAICAGGELDIFILIILLITAAISGDSTNYIIGRKIGMKLFSNPNSKIFRQDYLNKTNAFYAKHGGKTITLARFLPIVRTFAPFVAGISKMQYSYFAMFSVLGSIFWVGSLVPLGYFFGNVPFIKNNLSLIIVLIILFTLLPLLFSALNQRLKNK